MNPRPRRFALLTGCVSFASVVSLSLSLSASSPKFFQAATQADFLKGEVDNLSIDSNGQLMLGPATELVYEPATPFLWSVPVPVPVIVIPSFSSWAGSGTGRR